MRVQKDQVTGGMSAMLAREVVWRLEGRDSVAASIEDLHLKYGFEEPPDEVVNRFQKEGFDGWDAAAIGFHSLEADGEVM